ncbi:MAG: oxygen-independent coproporphyrinogen III oxidase, partial [Hyphomicrobium sp.]
MPNRSNTPHVACATAPAHDLIQRLATPLPRYTSYPTANHFSPAVDAASYADWLADLPTASALSLYLHIPYCRELCWYCGCSTKAVRRYEPVASYLELLRREAIAVARRLPRDHRVTHIHWGGGSPDILEPSDIIRLGSEIKGAFEIDANAEIAVEIDPRLLDAPRADAFAAIGINRVSIGVQDFDETVQKAIGRLQSYDTTRQAVELFRARGIPSINVDLVYGLPHQTEDSVARTIEQVLTLTPDRIAIFGYAHLPSRLKHQRLIDEAALPGAAARFAQSARLAEMLIGAGYVQLGLDHFARGTDRLATTAINRNFQGYTTDQADALLGFGASAISRLPQGYAQNAAAADDYSRRIEADGLATARGFKLGPDDKMRAFVIERLMCDFAFSSRELSRRFGNRAAAIVGEAEA